jgi:hypothetical protein
MHDADHRGYLSVQGIYGEMRRIDDFFFIGQHGSLVDHAEEPSLLMGTPSLTTFFLPFVLYLSTHSTK